MTTISVINQTVQSTHLIENRSIVHTVGILLLFSQALKSALSINVIMTSYILVTTSATVITLNAVVTVNNSPSVLLCC